VAKLSRLVPSWMSYEPRLERKVGEKIQDYILATYETEVARDLASREVEEALMKLAASPKRAVPTDTALFDNRPTHQFPMDADGTRRIVAVCFQYDHDDITESFIDVTGFAVPD
jgi:hypothetical protein